MDTRLLVRKDALQTTQIATTPDAALHEGQVRVRVDKFSFTSNNITYAAFGDAMKYWQFFPTGQEGWGNIPVWGFGTVVQSSSRGRGGGRAPVWLLAICHACGAVAGQAQRQGLF